MKKGLLFLCFSSLTMLSFSQTPAVVISQVYGGGGASTGSPAYTNDYVELHNRTAADFDISGFSLQYGSAAGVFGSSASNIYVFPASSIIPAYGYFTVKLGSAGTAGATFTADQTTANISMQQVLVKLL